MPGDMGFDGTRGHRGGIELRRESPIRATAQHLVFISTRVLGTNRDQGVARHQLSETETPEAEINVYNVLDVALSGAGVVTGPRSKRLEIPCKILRIQSQEAQM